MAINKDGMPQLSLDHRRLVRLSAYAGLQAAAVLSIASPNVSAQSLDEQVTLDIPADISLETALVQFSRQAGLQLMFAVSSVDEKSSAAGLNGTVEARAGLKAILGNSGLSFASVRNAVAIVPARDALDSEGTQDSSGADSGGKK